MTKHKRKKKNKYNFKDIKILIVGLILFIIPFTINSSTSIRLLLSLVSFIILVYYLNIKSNRHKITIFILLLLISIFIDTIISTTFVRIPIYAYNITTSGNTRVYSGIGYRIWQCDKNSTDNMKLDKFYSSGYICDVNDIEEIDSNSFLSSVVENYTSYENHYVKIKGKISKKNSQNSIEMRSYEKNDITVNGYVTFSDNITLKILFKEYEELLDMYDVYDEVTVTGIVKGLELNNDKYTVYLSESTLVEEDKDSSHEITIYEESKCTSDKKIIGNIEDYDIYSYCLDDIIVTYDNKKYELSSVLSSNKISLNDLLSNYISKENIVDSIIYNYDEYKILKCSNKNLILYPNGIDIDTNLCN